MFIYWRRLRAVLRTTYTVGQVPCDRESPHSDQAEQGRQGQVISKSWRQPQPFDQHAHDHETVVVIIQIAAGEPGVIRREGSALQHGGEIGQVHRLLAALPGVPQVRVPQPDEQESHKESQEQTLDHQEVFSALAPLLAQPIALAVNCQQAEPQDEQDHGADGYSLEGNFG